ncbi:MAG: hypothetical protein GVY15_09335 [Bacteroidetes bacterium]|jgi:hypothetical protein|nr:hypothetical protein [Bacteroidota bacterium]
MMHQDVLMRQVQQAAQAIAQLLMHRRNGQPDEALAVAQEALHLHFDLRADALHTYTYGHLAERFRFDTDAHADRARTLSDLLLHLGELRRVQDRGDALHPLRLALRLELDRAAHARRPLRSTDRIDRRARHLTAEALSTATRRLLVEQYTRAGQFAEAETWLFRWAKAAPPSDAPALAAAGEAFYAHLRAQPDAALAAGDLPRAEVAEGAEAFGAHLNRLQAA